MSGLHADDQQAGEVAEVFGEPIYAYTAEQAVQDGSLVRVPAELSRAPIYLSRALFEMVKVPAGMEGTQDLMGRMADLVNMARLAFSRGDQGDRMRTNIRVILKGHGTVAVLGVVDGAGLTLMLPEDY
jgi:hypothetical protein